MAVSESVSSRPPLSPSHSLSVFLFLWHLFIQLNTIKQSTADPRSLRRIRRQARPRHPAVFSQICFPSFPRPLPNLCTAGTTFPMLPCCSRVPAPWCCQVPWPVQVQGEPGGWEEGEAGVTQSLFQFFFQCFLSDSLSRLEEAGSRVPAPARESGIPVLLTPPPPALPALDGAGGHFLLGLRWGAHCLLDGPQPLQHPHKKSLLQTPFGETCRALCAPLTGS